MNKLYVCLAVFFLITAILFACAMVMTRDPHVFTITFLGTVLSCIAGEMSLQEIRR